VLIPYNTDAPLYHFPVVTIGLIVLNTAVLAACMQADPHAVVPWALQFGQGLHPLQWISNNFLHADILHLVGNMFFLWGFGLVVEGKLGWWRFLLLYLAMGAIYGFIIQAVMLGSHGAALGASGVIFGLMAIALVWAPKNEMSCFLLIFLRPQLVEVPITLFATVYLLWQGLAAWLTGFSMSSAMLHLTGAGVGAIAGVVLLKLDFVDCEGWDIFAIWAGREPTRLAERSSLHAPPAVPPPRQSISAEQAEFLVTVVKNRLVGGDVAGAAQFYQQQRAAHPEWRLGEIRLMELITSLDKRQLWSESVGPMVDYIRQFPENSSRVQLKLAHILIEVDRRPAKALKVLRNMDVSKLTPELLRVRSKLRGSAEQLQAECDLEVADGED
jgi:membrane associated rhomboid family serine protease